MKTTALGGFLGLLPIAIVVFILGKVHAAFTGVLVPALSPFASVASSGEQTWWRIWRPDECFTYHPFVANLSPSRPFGGFTVGGRKTRGNAQHFHEGVVCQSRVVARGLDRRMSEEPLQVAFGYTQLLLRT